jgi:hypothetical protein
MLELTMRHVPTIVTLTAVWGGLVSGGTAADQAKVDDPAKAAANADLRAEIHQTLADLIEARSAETPDQAKVEALTQKLQELRSQWRGQRPATADGWTCPRRGPGMGRGAGWGCVGRGWCGGAGGGRGRGLGPGAGQGRAPGGPAFVDKNNSGVCDNFEQRQQTNR